jgi:acyl carrier protein
VPTITRPEAYQLVSTLLSAQFEVDPAAIEPDARLADLGLDSLAAVELFDVLQERTGVPLEIDDADLALTVEELAARLVDEQGVSASVARGASVSVDQA